MYVCGLIVYDYIYIGNVCLVIFFDIVCGYLEQIGYEVNYVVNFMDVDDKLICKVEQLGIDVFYVVEKFIVVYYEDFEGLGIFKVSSNLRVMENMLFIIDFI